MIESNFNFESLLQPKFQLLSSTFWTPTNIIEIALNWFEVSETSKILDIGSGVGKFCILGNSLSKGQFTGVEIRENLIKESKRITEKLKLTKSNFIHSDIKEIDFSQYNSFFYYNPFCEHLSIDEIIDDTLELSRENHQEYENFISMQFNQLPTQTKVITYASNQFIFPSSYRLIKMDETGDLVLWEKE